MVVGSGPLSAEAGFAVEKTVTAHTEAKRVPIMAAIVSVGNGVRERFRIMSRLKGMVRDEGFEPPTNRM